MPNEQKISRAVVSRLPKYYRYLGEAHDQGIKRTSSKKLSEIMNITASQIRQDLNNFGSFGLQGYGYDTELLYNEIGKILGLDKKHKLILIGCGKIGQALLKYEYFTSRGFTFEAAFDKSEDLIGTTVNGVKIHDVSELADYLSTHHINIVALTIPKGHIGNTVDIINKSSVQGVWNFINMDIEFREGIKVENVHLMDSLMTLSYKIDEDEIINRYNVTTKGEAIK